MKSEPSRGDFKLDKEEKVAVIDVFRNASRLLKEVGWCQGAMKKMKEDGTTPTAFCLYGAIQHKNPMNSYLAQEAISNYLNAKFPGCLSMSHWNDRPERKKREVLDALRFTANRLEKEVRNEI